MERNLLDLKKLLILLPFGTFPFEERAIYGVTSGQRFDGVVCLSLLLEGETTIICTNFYDRWFFHTILCIHKLSHTPRMQSRILSFESLCHPHPLPAIPPPLSPARSLSTHLTQYFILFFTGGESFNPTGFRWKDFHLCLYPCNWFELNSALLWPFISNDLFLVYLPSLQQTSATSCGALDVLMFAKDSK